MQEKFHKEKVSDMINKASRMIASPLMCIVIIVASGCNSEKKAAERKAKLEENRLVTRKRILEIEKQIVELESQKKAIYQEIERRESLWRSAVKARHPEWTIEKEDRHIAILDYKWFNSNRIDDAETVKGMVSTTAQL